jgi:hypothetical protein
LFQQIEKLLVTALAAVLGVFLLSGIYFMYVRPPVSGG